MKLILILVVLACLSQAHNCLAADRIMVDAYTHHSSGEWKRPNRMSWQHDLTEDLASDIGAGHNSYGKLSFNAGLIYQPLKVGSLSAGAFVSLVSGYTCEQLKTCAVAGGLIASYEVGTVTMQVLYVPAISDGVSVTQARIGMRF